MSLAGEYNDLLLTEFLIERLKDGYVPYTEDILEDYYSLVKEYPRVTTVPLFSIINNKVAYYSNASASKTNDTFERLEKDIHLLFEVSTELQTKITKQSRRWSTYYETTKRYLDDLEDRIDSLLLMNSDTLGYFKYVSDDFLTLDQVDLDNTTAEVDAGSGLVTIANNTFLGDEQTRVDLSGINDSYITINKVSGPGVVSINDMPGYSRAAILTDVYDSWLAQLKTTGQDQPGVISVQIRLSDSVIDFNKVVVAVAGSTATSAYTLSLFYSDNGFDWLLVPTEAHTQSVLDNGTWSFETISAKYIKVLMTKNSYNDIDANGYYGWDFGIKTIKLYNDTYETRVGYGLRSTSLVPDTEDTYQFTKAALSVCETVTEETDITYYISVDDGSSFHAIDPLERTDPSRPQVIDFSELQLYSNVGSSNLYDATRTALQLDVDNTAGETVEAGELPLNFFIRSADISSLDEGAIVVYRNIGSKTSSLSVRNKSAGWGFDEENNIYSSYIYISDPDGFDVDFGPATGASIDDVPVSDQVHIEPGVHLFKTLSNNWAEVTSSLTSITDLKAADSLYPNNHKLLIEGYNYGTGYADEEIYNGVSIFAESISSYVSDQGFTKESDSNDLSIYTRRSDSNNNMNFIFKTDRSYSDYANEQIVINYPLVNKSFSSVILKANLSTTNSSITPILDGYLIKLG